MTLRKRIGALLVATVVALVGAIAIATPAHAGSYLHVVRHWDSRLCLEVPYDPATGTGSMVMGAQLRIGICGPNDQTTWYQNFWFEDVTGAPNWYFLRPGHNLWCIQPGAPALVRSTIIQWACTWRSEQMWLLQQVGTGPTYTLRNGSSLMCLTVDGTGLGEYARQSFDCAQGVSHISQWLLPLPGH